MCFSASASFATSAVLLPLGVMSLRRLSTADSGYRTFAAFPLLFGVQQFLEGVLWLSLAGDSAVPPKLPALAFLFFVFCVWPILVPHAAFAVEDRLLLKRLFGAMRGLGALFGLAMFTPLLMYDDWFGVNIIENSVHYSITSIFDGRIPEEAVGLVYTLLALLPLLLSCRLALRQFGLLVLVSFIISVLLYSYAFISVWCFFAALLSLQVLWIVLQIPAGKPVPGESRLSPRG